MNQVLDRIKKWCLNNFVNDETLIMMLIGSSVHQKSVKDSNDVDILRILENSTEEFSKDEQKFEGIKIDHVTVGDTYLRQLFNKKAAHIFDLNMQSAFFEPIRDGVVWYQKYDKTVDLIEIARNWTWDPKYQEFFEFDLQEPKSQLFKNAYSDQLEVLNVLKSNLKNNLGISYRRKDLPGLASKSTKAKVQQAIKNIMPIYEQLSVREEWEFVPYVHIAMNKGDWGKALDNLKDILLGLIYSEFRDRSKSYFDPSIWTVAEENGLSKELMNAVESIYL